MRYSFMKLSKILALLMVACLTFSLCACSINLPTTKKVDEVNTETGSEIDEDALREEIKAELREELEEEMKELKEETEKEEKEQKEEREQDLKPSTEDKEEDKPVSIPTSSGTISDDWADLEFILDGKKYVLPFEYKELTEDGWYLDESDYDFSEGKEIDGGMKVLATIHLNNPKYATDSFGEFELVIGFINYSKEPKEYKDCDIYSIEFKNMYGYSEIENYGDVKIAGGIGFGSTEEEVLAAFGEPESEYNAEKYTSYTWRKDYKTLRIDVYKDGGVGMIEISK